MKKFSTLAENNLNWYVYSLRCRKTKKYAYIGKGRNSRIFEHRNSMRLSESRKNNWLISNEFYEYIHSSHETSQGAYEAEALLISMLKRHKELIIKGRLLNDVSGHHEIMMTAERYEKLYGEKGEFDKKEVNKVFKACNRKGVILNIVKSAKNNRNNDVPYRELSFGFNNNLKEKLHLAEEVFIRFKGTIVEHWIDVRWEYDEKNGNTWTGIKIDSPYSNTRIIGPTRNSQQSVIYLNMDYCYRKKQLKQ